MADELAPIATKLVFEDDYVRIWHQLVPAGGTIDKHAHLLDYFLLNVAGEGPFDITFHDGTGGKFGEHATFAPRPGASPGDMSVPGRFGAWFQWVGSPSISPLGLASVQHRTRYRWSISAAG